MQVPDLARYCDVSTWLRSLRQRNGWTQADLGQVLSVDSSHVSHWETEQHPVTEEYCERMAKAFDIEKRRLLALQGYVNWARLEPAVGTGRRCETCSVRAECDVAATLGLPIYCEAVTGLDWAVAATRGLDDLLMARYNDEQRESFMAEVNWALGRNDALVNV